MKHCNGFILIWIILALFMLACLKGLPKEERARRRGRRSEGITCYHCPHIYSNSTPCNKTKLCRDDHACTLTLGLIDWRQNTSETIEQSCIKIKRCKNLASDSCDITKRPLVCSFCCYTDLCNTLIFEPPCVTETKASSEELTAGLYSSFYTYLAMANHFDRYDVALSGFNKYMMTSTYLGKMRAITNTDRKMNSLGLPLVFDTIPAPAEVNWATPKQALEAALAMELREGDRIRRTISASKGCGEITTLSSFLETEVLVGNYKVIKELAELIVSISNMQSSLTPGIADFLVDKQIEDGRYFYPVYAAEAIPRYGNESTGAISGDDKTMWENIVPTFFTPLVFG